MDANLIADKWIARLGLGFHPDTIAESYTPEFPPSWVPEYEADLDFLANADDPYQIGLDAMARAGLIG